MLGELLPEGAAGAGIEMLAYGQGPGSFTGLRIAASAVQGLAYTLSLAGGGSFYAGLPGPGRIATARGR